MGKKLNMSETSKRPNATLADVAARAGVSRMTVSKVLRNTGSFSKDTRSRIHAAVEELGYVKNSLAGLLSSQKSVIVGIIIPSASDSVFAEVLSGTNSTIRPHGYSTLIGETLFDPQIEYDILSTMLSLQPAGLIMSAGVDHLEKTRALIDQRRCPLISVWDKDNPEGDMTLGLSHHEAGRRIAEHFLERGHRLVGYVGSELTLDTCARYRFEGFRSVLEVAGISVRAEIAEDAPRQSPTGRRLTESLLQKFPDTSAIFYLNDAMALGGLSWLHNAGISVPGQVAAAGFNGTSIDHEIRTRLTTIDVPRRAIGVAAASALLAYVSDKTDFADPNLDTDLDGHLRQGNTT